MARRSNQGSSDNKEPANWIKPQKEPENIPTPVKPVNETWLAAMVGSMMTGQGQRESTFTKGERSKVTRKKRTAKKSQRRNRR